MWAAWTAKRRSAPGKIGTLEADLFTKKQPKEEKVHLWKISWDESLMASGIPELDLQHREWLSRFNEFEQAIDLNKGEEACTRALLFFIHYTDTHFKFEEDLMEHYHCPARFKNKDEHEQFRTRMQEITYMTWPLGATGEDVLRLEEELVNWLKEHICAVDMQLRACVD
jgi:hemerythrin